MTGLRRGLLLWLAVCGHTKAAEPPLRVATGEYPPYACAACPGQGLTLKRVRAAFEAAGLQVEFAFMPWARALQDTAQGGYAATAFWAHDAARDTDFLHSTNLASGSWHWVQRRHEALPARPVVGMVRAYSYPPAVTAEVESGRMLAQALVSDSTGLQMLLLGRIDLLPLEPRTACTLSRSQLTPAEAARLTATAQPPIATIGSHVLFPRRLQGSAALLERFDRGLAALPALQRPATSAPECEVMLPR